MIRGFGPIVGPGARVLVLGTIPSRRSLELQQYYGHPQNAFWPIMQALFAGGARLDYPARAEMLVGAGVALWDVLYAAERDGSLDSSIDADSEVPNDIAGLLAAHPGIGLVFFNGAKAEALFRRHVAGALPPDCPVRFRRLPSTSPANAGTTVAAKLEAWRAVAAALPVGPARRAKG
jgi:hypoxanthine-DNA glycosylase